MWDNRAQAVRMTTALIALSAKNRNEPGSLASIRSNAVFVAHLIATAAQMPQTRARRRAEPDEASAAYRALGQWPSTAGSALSRSL
jgi:hypothetical protein